MDMKLAYNLLKWRNRSYEVTVKEMEDCEERHRKHTNDYGCNNCEIKLKCDKEFDYQVDTRKGYSWRLRDRNSKRADTKGGLPDKTGSWIPTFTTGFKDEILRY